MQIFFPKFRQVTFKIWFKFVPTSRSSGSAIVLEREVWGSNLGPVKSNTKLPTAPHHCNISSKGAVLPSGAMTQKWAPQTRYKLQRNTTNIMKDLICYLNHWVSTSIKSKNWPAKFCKKSLYFRILKSFGCVINAKVFGSWTSKWTSFCETNRFQHLAIFRIRCHWKYFYRAWYEKKQNIYMLVALSKKSFLKWQG